MTGPENAVMGFTFNVFVSFSPQWQATQYGNASVKTQHVDRNVLRFIDGSFTANIPAYQ